MKSAALKLLNGFVILSLVLSFFPRPLTAKAVSKAPVSDTLPQVEPPDPLAHVRADSINDQQTQALNVVLDRSPATDWMGVPGPLFTVRPMPMHSSHASAASTPPELVQSETTDNIVFLPLVVTGGHNQAAVSPEGAELTFAGGLVQVNFPPGAVSEQTIVSFEMMPPVPRTTSSRSISHFSLQAAMAGSGTPVNQFDMLVTIRVQYPTNEVPSDAGLDFYYRDVRARAWVPLSTRVDPEQNTAQVTTSHFSEFALMASTNAATYVPVVEQPPIDQFSFNGVPFEYHGVDRWVTRDPGNPYPPSEIINLSGYSGTAVHMITYGSWDLDLPTGTTLGYAIIHYGDGDTDTIPLVLGQNTASWAYDRPEAQYCLVHNKIPQWEAYSWNTNQDSNYFYYAHNFYTAAPIQPKPLFSLELAINPGAYLYEVNTGSPCYTPGKYNVGVNGLTIQTSGAFSIDQTPPTIANIAVWNDGLGQAVIQAKVTDDTSVAWVGVTLNGVEYEMTLWQGNTYAAAVPVQQGTNTYYIEAVDLTGNTAREPSNGEFEVWITMDGLFGNRPGTGYSNDPVNTGIGNYIFSYTDVEVIAFGPNIAIERWFNGQSRYDGPFGTGWTFIYDMRLTEVDNMLFSGVQIRYADGHTANFESDGAGGFVTPDANYDTLQQVGNEYVLTLKDQMVYRFNTEGRLIAIADQDGNQLTFSYTAEDLTGITDASGRAITLSYTDDRITSIAIPDYGTLEYAYLDGRLISVSDTEGSQAQYEYDADGYLIKITSPNGNPFLAEQTYDDQARVTFQRGGTGFINEFTYDDDNNTTIILDAYGNPTTHVYDDDHRLIEEIDALGYSTTYTYNDDNEKLTVTDKNGHTTTYTYDDDGNPLTITDPLGNVTTFTYDAMNNVLSKTDALGNVFAYDYDSEGHLIRATDPLGGVIEHTYNDQGLLIRTVDPRGNATEMTYNHLGLPIAITDVLGNVSTMTYDAAGHLLSHTDAEGNTATYQYNSLDLPLSVTDPEGYVTTYVYDADQNLILETNQDGYNKTYAYDENGRLVAETDWAGNLTQYVYDDLGRKILEIDPLSYTISYTYDVVGNLTAMTDKRGATTTYAYDPNGNLLTETNALGYVTTHRYDALNRRTETEGPCACSSRIERTVYDPLGRVVERIDALGNSTHYEYDALGRETRRIDASGYETLKEYDLAGNLIAETDALSNTTYYEYDALNQQGRETNRLGDTVTNEYDKSGRLVAVTNERGFATRYVYDGNNRLLQEINALGGVTAHTYDGRGNRLTMTDALGRVTVYTYDANGNQVSVTNPRGYTTTNEYDAMNRKIRMIDALGGVTTYTYDPAGALLTETDPLGCTRQTTYDILGRRVAETDRNGNTTSFEYDPAGNLIRTTDALGAVTNWTYDANNNKSSETNALGHTTGYEYDPLNRQVRVFDALGGVSTRVYDPLGRVVEDVDANGNATHYTYDAEGHRISTIDALDHAITYAYDPAGNQIQVMDRNGHATRYAYDPLNRQVTLTNALGYIETTRYDAVGNRIRQVNFRGYPIHFEYDANDNLILKIDALGGETANQYDALDRQVAVTDANGHTTSYTYDAVGNGLTVTLPEGQISSYTYDCERNRLTYTNAKGYITTYTYDTLNRQISEADPLEHVTQTEYDTIGQKICTIDAVGNRTDYAYDALGRLVAVTDALGYNTLYSYDPVGNILGETDANGHTTTYTHDALNRLVAETNPLSHTWTYAYDPEDNLIQQVDANNQVIDYEFDAVNQLVTIQYPDSRQDVSFVYDPNGNLVHMLDGVGTTELSYDPLDREIAKTDPYGRALENGYDPVGNRLSITYPSDDEATYRYNANDWLVEMTDPRGGSTVYSYDPDALPTRTNFPNDTWTDRVYDAAGRLVGQFNGTTYNAGVVTAYDYTLDAVGNRLRTIERYTSGEVRTITKTYQYNARYELLHAVEEYEGPPPYTVMTTYTYDRAGNRLNMTTNRDIGPDPQPPPDAMSYTYDAANRMLSAGPVTFTYDANGNRLSKLTPGTPPAQTSLETYEYDAENRLRRYTRASIQSGFVEQRVYNVYDGLGRRLNKGTQDASGTIEWVQYALDGLSYDQLVEFPQTGPPRITQLYRGQFNQLVSMDEIQGDGTGSQYWFATDGLGSMAATTKQDGQSAHEYFYDPYGQIIDENGHWEDSSSWTNPHNHYLLTGKEWDEESRLYYFGARFYDAEAGVWLTQDPYRGHVNSPMTRHRTLYVRNNPITRIDPLGFFDWNTGQVGWGDTLTQIAQDAGVSVAQIVSWNPQIEHPDVVYVGMHLSLPQDAINAGKRAEAIRNGAGAGETKWGKPGSNSSCGKGLGSNYETVNCPSLPLDFKVSAEFDFGIPPYSEMGFGGFLSLDVGVEKAQKGQKGQIISGAISAGVAWKAKNNKAFYAIGELGKKLGFHLIAEVKIGGEFNVEYNICTKDGEVKFCFFASGELGIEAWQQGAHDFFTGQFTRQRVGLTGTIRGDVCADLCTGDITWSWNASWSLNFELLNFEAGGEIGESEQYLTTWDRAAILKELCRN